MKLGGSLGNVAQKLIKTCYKNSIYFGLLVYFQEYNYTIVEYTVVEYELYS
jgi:hypothetical protein